jgi:hypothetical protein
VIPTKELDPRIIRRHTWSIYSQNGEDGVLAYLTSLVQMHTHEGYRFCTEIGGNLSPDGNPECNTANLIANGWEGSIYDCQEIRHPWFKQRVVTVDNINEIVPTELGVLSIDVDGNDYWLWKACEARPEIVVIEYNSALSVGGFPRSSLVMPYDPEFRWDGSDYFGASASAMARLGHAKGYKLVYVEACLNLFFLRNDLLDNNFLPPSSLCFGPVTRHPTDRSGRKYLEV